MTFPKIEPDDIVLFGSLALFAIGAAFITAATIGDGLAAVGVALLVFGGPAALIAFMAAAEPSK